MSVPSQSPADPATLYILDFELIKEGWSVYTLGDGNKIRARVMIVSVRGRSIPPKKGELIMPESSVTVKVDSPPNRRGSKGSPATPEETSDPKGHGGEEVEVLTSNEPWNEYHLVGTDVRIRIKLVLNRVMRIKDRYDLVGDPVYVVNFTIVPAIES